MPEGDKDRPFRYSRLLLCEGPDDAAFFNRLIEVRNLRRFEVRFTNSKTDKTGGNTKFGLKLRAIKFNPAYDKIRNILIVSDNDTDPATSLKNVIKQVKQAELLPAPIAELVASTSRPVVTIMMLPLGGQGGNIEYVCSHVAKRKRPAMRAHIENFSAVVGAGQWTNSRRGKMELRAALAVTCERNPCVELVSVFQTPRYRQDNLIPLTDNAFKPIVDILEAIP